MKEGITKKIQITSTMLRGWRPTIQNLVQKLKTCFMHLVAFLEILIKIGIGHGIASSNSSSEGEMNIKPMEEGFYKSAHLDFAGILPSGYLTIQYKKEPSNLG